jgi:two-component system, chemotaxis family, chemotaxis protein CheY
MLESGLVPDVIITDLMMPRLDGYQLIAQLKKNDPYKKIPVIVLSNVDKKQDREKLVSKGIYGYLNKPFSPDELRENLTQMLDNALIYCN